MLDEEESSLVAAPLVLDESSVVVAFAVVAVSDWPEPACVASLVAVLPSEPLAADRPESDREGGQRGGDDAAADRRDPPCACAQTIADQVGVRGGGRRRGHAGKARTGPGEQPGDNLGER